MNIDERLENLAGTVQLLVNGMVKHDQVIARLEKHLASLQGLVDDIALGTARLLSDSEQYREQLRNHEQRIRNLESE
jgi:TolA-binding protein